MACAIDLRTAQLASEMGITNHFCKNKAPTAQSLGIAPLGVRLGGSSATANSPPALTSSLNEFQEILIDRLGVSGEHAMRETRIELQGRVLKELDLEQGRAFVRNDLVVFALHDKCWYIDALQVLSEVRFRERLDTVVVGLGPANHALAPPIPNNTIQWLGPRSVKPVEYGRSEIAIKLSAIGGQAFPKAVENRNRQAVRIIR